MHYFCSATTILFLLTQRVKIVTAKTQAIGDSHGKLSSRFEQALLLALDIAVLWSDLGWGGRGAAHVVENGAVG